jgi:hypothetical protein
VLAGVPAVSVHPFDVSCETLHQNVNVSIAAAISGAQPVDFSLRNRPPVPKSWPRRRPDGWLGVPGRDRPGDCGRVGSRRRRAALSLAGRQRPGHPVDAATIAWPLLGVEAANTITLEVGDGGGFAERQLVLGTSPTGDRFIGTVWMARPARRSPMRTLSTASRR